MNSASPLLYAHRGLHGISPTEVYAENTYEAFEHALRNEYDGIELDVHLTKDNEMIVIHDDTINRTSYCNKTTKVKNMNMKDIRKFKLKNGKEKYPLLIDVLRLVKDYEKRVIIDVKTTKERALRNILNIMKKIDILSEQIIVLWWGDNSYIKKYHKKINIYRAYDNSVILEKTIKNIPKYYFSGICLTYTGKKPNLKTIEMANKYGLGVNLSTTIGRKKICFEELKCGHLTL